MRESVRGWGLLEAEGMGYKGRWREGNGGDMLGNKYLDRSIQKAFMTATPGCTEHHSKLGTILHEAKQRHRSVTTAWLDLANAYGSVHHSLIQFSLHHYHASPKFSAVVESLYDGIAAEVMSEGWSTPLIPLQRGVYQGDPLSVVIFNTVINTLIDTIRRGLIWIHSSQVISTYCSTLTILA